ncbi:DNA repair protein endonuclease SAE2/CtIP C-terminus-domain-containing protein [Aspergillus cavernicola]|uniref:DNA repair protein endonuclease SAE2/CtIP C-terminus-domain-containing protein n=1 Tax=Aspergillus cavernicola TaxID=176166 RepID=A0ABR4ICE4_9EURO
MDALKKLHTSVAQTFETCFDNAYKDLNAELAANDARVKDAKKRTESADEARRKLASEVDELRQVNALLREELQDTSDSNEGEFTAKVSKLAETYEPRRILGDNHTSDISEKSLKTLRDSYIGLYEQVRIFVQASEDLREITKRRKRQLARFNRFVHQQEFTLVLEGHPVRFQRAVKTESSKQGSPAESITSTREPVASTSEVDQGQTGSRTGDELDNTSETRLQREHLKSASTPSDTSDDLPPNTAAASSARRGGTFKRKYSAFTQAVKGSSFSRSLTNGGPGHPIMVKGETLSSSPLRTYSSHPGPPGTQDLDDIGSIIVTPTKKMRVHRDLGHQAPRDPLTNTESLSIQHMRRQNHTSGRNQLTSRGPEVLQPVDTNLRNTSSAGQLPNKTRTRDLGCITRISSITEDGDENRPSRFIKEKEANLPKDNATPRNPSSDHRLSGLLAGPSPGSRVLPAKRTISTSAPTQNSTRHISKGSSSACHSGVTGASDASPATSGLTRGKPKSIMRQGNADKIPHPPENVSQIRMMPDDEPYRARPAHRLGLEHFRINPEFNNGLNFAYNEVVRRKNERKCAGGCTRPGCCGEKFLAMARFGIPTNTSGKEMNDQEILEEYLGDDKQAFHGLSPKEREDLLVKAKVRVFSNRFGRHRHRHHRAGTPPGFWRTDMPGTQEMEEDREEAQKVERDKVNERYREAMRPGGRWVFADE